MLVILVYLVFLVLSYININTMTSCSLWQWVVYGSGISCNISWVLVATAANQFTLAASYGWTDAYGVAGTPHTASLVIEILAYVSVIVATMRHDFAWSLVAVWLFAGL